MVESKRLGEALSRIQGLIEKRDNIHILHSSEISRTDRELLVGTGWLQEITKGWYLLTRPDVQPGDSSAWYASFWDFLYLYLSKFFGKEYCLSAECSLDLHLGMTTVPKQVIVMAPKGRGAPLALPFDTSLLIYTISDELPRERVELQKLQAMTLPLALCKVSPLFFQRQPQEAEIALQSINNSEELLRIIVSNNFVRAAGRLMGGYRFLHNQKMVDALQQGLTSINMRIQEVNPFSYEKPLLEGRSRQSPYVARIQAMWSVMREDVIAHFPKPSRLPSDSSSYLEYVEEHYTQDAYHSLSIEGYQVDHQLIEKVKKAEWSPDFDEKDRKQQDALAARGYYESFQSVKKSLSEVLNGADPGLCIENSLADWYRKLFAPCVAAGIISAQDLFGYRRAQVYIRNSRHTPPPAHSLDSAMESFFESLKAEKNAAVRVVLGHFIFVFIHPYMDGNGRIGRFLMNVMLASGGYPWTIVHVERRMEYLNALEKASVERNIIPFTQFLSSEMTGKRAGAAMW